MMFRRPRQESPAHLRFIRQLPCVICKNDIETEAAHLRAGNREYGKRTTGLQEKPDDKWTLPLCGPCHKTQHLGNETGFWNALGIDPWKLCLTLWGATGNHEWAEIAIFEQTGKP